MSAFSLFSEFVPQGDQPQAIERLVQAVQAGDRHQVLLGVTGSGKTFTVAKLIEAVGRPALVLSHNKTLAAQLYQEFKRFFPHDAVEFFVSYYDYYQPEAYVAHSDTYIEKETSINEEIERLRLRATTSIIERRDVLVVSSVSCIYGLGSPDAFKGMLLFFEKGDETGMDGVLRRLAEMQYKRTQLDLLHGSFRVRGDVLEILPAYDERGIRVEYFGDEIERLSRFDVLTGRVLEELDTIPLYPRTHYVTPRDRLEIAIRGIEDELEERLLVLDAEGKLVEAQRLEQRTRFDLEMLRELGYCQGIENYSRHLSGRSPGEPPPTLIDYLPDDFLMIIDESHQTVPQVRGMYAGDRARKETLVEHGFRLPSALDNRPLTFEEFEERVGQTIYVSATPSPWELEKSQGVVVEQVIRPTGLLDPEVEIRPARNQIDDLLAEAQKIVEAGDRILITTLTKRMAEELTQFLLELGLRARYLHSDIDTLERVEITAGLRRGDFDILVGINLLREGLDLPEVALVAVLDADKEGFLRSETSLIQTAGRASRNVRGRVLLYADVITGSIERTIAETNRRRALQRSYNEDRGIEPRSIVKEVEGPLVKMANLDYYEGTMGRLSAIAESSDLPISDQIRGLEKQMREAAKKLEFEQAAALRDRISELRDLQIFSG